MAFRGAAAGLLILIAACSGGSDAHPEDVVFRVGATAGLSELTPRRGISGSAAAAVDLVFDFAPSHVEVVGAEGRRLILQRRSSSPFAADQLASSMRSVGLVSAAVIGPDRIEAVFQDEAAAKLAMSPWLLAFDLGPFAIESQEPGSVRLRRRGNSAIDVIEIDQVSSSDEWRKLLARELDVMSSSPSLYRDQFAGIESVRLIDIPPTISAVLYFNVRDPALADADVRRRIASSINRQAIARVASGDPSSAAPPLASGTGAEVPLPAHLSLLVIEDESTLLLAASVVRHQLARLGIAVEVEPMALEDLLKNRVDKGASQLVLVPASNGERSYARFLSPEPDRPSMTGFADPEYDAAVGAGDLDRAQAILERELPATVLYEWRTFAAIDSRFCGNVTPSVTSWRWMASLFPCEDGEGEGKPTP